VGIGGAARCAPDGMTPRAVHVVISAGRDPAQQRDQCRPAIAETRGDHGASRLASQPAGGGGWRAGRS
jgi:hypothetical protein